MIEKGKIDTIRMLATPLMQYLSELHNPHCHFVVETDRVTLHEELCSTGRVDPDLPSHKHSLCHCGTGPSCGHILGEDGCARRWLQGEPKLKSGSPLTGTYGIDGREFSAHQILTQRGSGAHQHECGCWSAVP